MVEGCAKPLPPGGAGDASVGATVTRRVRFIGACFVSNAAAENMEDDIPPIDLEALDRYLLSDLSPDECMMLSDLDGFLTGIVIGPELIPPSEWLPAIWGGDEPGFESVEQMQTIIGTIMGRYNEIATAMNAEAGTFEPIFWEGSDKALIVMDWAAGFLDAVALRRKAWEPLFNHRRAKTLIEPLLILGDNEAFADKRVTSAREKQFYASKQTVISTCIDGIYNFWKDWQDRQKPQPRRGKRPRR